MPSLLAVMLKSGMFVLLLLLVVDIEYSTTQVGAYVGGKTVMFMMLKSMPLAIAVIAGGDGIPIIIQYNNYNALDKSYYTHAN